MQQFINAIIRFRNALIFLSLLSASFILLTNSSAFHQTQIKNMGLWLSGTVFQAQTGFSDYFFLQKQNLNLRQENKLLLEQIIELRNKTNASTHEAFNFDVVQARIIKGSFKDVRNMLVLNKGAEDGVVPEMGIISSQGVVGITNNTTAHFSSGLSLLHKDLQINAKLKNTNAFGSLFWPGIKPNIMKLTDVASINSIAIGDTIVTGGMSSYFPQNIPIGKIFNYKILPSKRYYEIDVQLFHNFSKLDEVYLIKNHDKNEIERLN